MKGLVKRSTGSWYDVLDPVGHKLYKCRIAGKMKLQEKELTNPVAVGDFVDFSLENEEQGIINTVQARRNFVARQSPRQKHQVHIIAANLDQALVVSTIREPDLKLGFIDRFLLTTEPQDIPTLIALNKCDLWDEEDNELYEGVNKLYSDIGYTVLRVSASRGDGIEELRDILSGRTTLISGQSGAGKSSLLNAVHPGIGLRTSELSGYSGKGTHTTTFAEMFEIGAQTYVIDTPGIKTLGFNNLEIMDVAHNFREFFPLSPQCRFGSICTHRNEPDCAVKNAIEEGKISPLRYQSYLSICEEIDAQNYWERKKKY